MFWMAVSSRTADDQLEEGNVKCRNTFQYVMRRPIWMRDLEGSQLSILSSFTGRTLSRILQAFCMSCAVQKGEKNVTHLSEAQKFSRLSAITHNSVLANRHSTVLDGCCWQLSWPEENNMTMRQS